MSAAHIRTGLNGGDTRPRTATDMDTLERLDPARLDAATREMAADQGFGMHQSAQHQQVRTRGFRVGFPKPLNPDSKMQLRT